MKKARFLGEKDTTTSYDRNWKKGEGRVKSQVLIRIENEFRQQKRDETEGE